MGDRGNVSDLEGKEMGKEGVLNWEKMSPKVNGKGMRRAQLAGRCGGQ